MEFLYFLEGLRTDWLTAFFSAITELGGETVLLAIAITVYWCLSKEKGYYLLTVGFFGTLINQFLKLCFRVPRPWVRDPNFTIVESAREGAGGYSFPSGHTQSAAAALGCPARFTKSKALRISCIVLILLTGLSRMYLGVHTPADVGVSLLVGFALVMGLYPLFEKAEDNPKYIYIITGVLALCSLACLLFVELWSWPADIDAENLESGLKNSYKLLGCSAGMLLAWFVESRYVRFELKAPLWAQLVKVVVGLLLVLAVKEGTKPVLGWGGFFSYYCLRYLIVVMFAACVWPLSFRFFAKKKEG